MFGFIKKLFFGLLSVCAVGSFDVLLATNYKEPIKYIHSNNQSCQTRPTIVNDETLFYPFTVIVNKCGGSCNTVVGSYARVSNKVKNMNAKLFSLMSQLNKTRFLVQLQSCECKCRLNESVFNSKQKWIHDECWGGCKN